MSATRVWFNKGFSSTYNVLAAIREADTGDDYRLLASHTHPEFAALAVADEVEIEPPKVFGRAYVDWCLGVCKRRGVDVLWAAKSAARLAESAHEFERIGTRVLVAGRPDVLRLVDHKAKFYASLPHEVVPLPSYAVVRTLEEFDAAWARLRALHTKLCVKPAVSVFGLGFRVVEERGSDLDRLLDGQVTSIGLSELRRLLGERPQFRDLMLMQYLEGPERSIDALAHEGRLVAAVVRRKASRQGGAQHLEDNPGAVEVARKLAERLQLSGIFNFQLRDAAGVPYLLELNPRMSGGLHFANESGVVFPYWALQLFTGRVRPEDVPEPRAGARVQQVNVGFALPVPQPEPVLAS